MIAAPLELKTKPAPRPGLTDEEWKELLVLLTPPLPAGVVVGADGLVAWDPTLATNPS